MTARKTSDRHTGLLNAYRDGDSAFHNWAAENLGDFAMTDWSYGALSMEWRIDDRFIMPDGIMFGGHIACVGDHIAGLIAMTVLTDDSERFRTSKLETNYFRPLMKPSARIEARVTNASRSLIHVEADIFNADDKLAVRMNAIQMRRAAT